MKEFEEVRAKLLSFPSGATVPLSHQEIDILVANCAQPQAWDLSKGYVLGRYFGLEAAPGSKLTEEAVLAAAREIRGLRLGDHFWVRCPVLFYPMKPLTLEELKAQVFTPISTSETFLLDEKLAAKVWPESRLDK